jgi:hypothetical protein
LKAALQIYIEAAESVKKENISQDHQILRMIQHFSEESDQVIQEMATGIATIEQQSNVLEAIYQMAGKALGKL